ncbi:MAG: hypothetical protein KGY50_04740 [Candidatus Thermoplasmatota archaeon]|nr:hypothetical protein [Candidatus Thermoplasmatota archaeon]
MKNAKKVILIAGILLSLLLLPTLSSQTTDMTTIEIINIKGGVGGVTVDVKNTGDNTANDVWVTTSINGGLLNGVDLVHECSGSCSECVPLEPGAIKSENTLEAGFLFGIGAVEITTSAGANNAATKSMEKTGFVLGPIVLIQ